jgi:hypothetical protein
MYCLWRGTEKPPSVRLVIVRGDQRGAPGAESTIDKEFYTANREAFVETIVDKTRYLGAPVVIGGGIVHHVELDLSQSALSVSTIYVIKAHGQTPLISHPT